VKLFAFLAGKDRSDMALMNPLDEAVGTKVLVPYFFYLIQHPEGNLLFDSGLHPSVRTHPAERLGAAANGLALFVELGQDVVSRLHSVGLSPRDVGHVAHSHLHFDHAGGIEFFPNAQFYIRRAELPFAHWPPVYQQSMYVRADFDHAVNWMEVEGDHDVFGDGRLILFPTPGHTPGHQSLLVRLDRQAIILVGDAAYLRKNIEQRLLTASAWSPDAMVASWERIEAMRRRYDATLIITHDLDWETSTRLGPDHWYE
jgi:N-acyl homoserine lactone hydrolase